MWYYFLSKKQQIKGVCKIRRRVKHECKMCGQKCKNKDCWESGYRTGYEAGYYKGHFRGAIKANQLTLSAIESINSVLGSTEVASCWVDVGRKMRKNICDAIIGVINFVNPDAHLELIDEEVRKTTLTPAPKFAARASTRRSPDKTRPRRRRVVRRAVNKTRRVRR